MNHETLTVGLLTNLVPTRPKMRCSIVHKRPLLVGNFLLMCCLFIHRVLVLSWRGTVQVVTVVFPRLLQLLLEITPLIQAPFHFHGRGFLPALAADVALGDIGAGEYQGLVELRNVGGDVFVVE